MDTLFVLVGLLGKAIRILGIICAYLICVFFLVVGFVAIITLSPGFIVLILVKDRTRIKQLDNQRNKVLESQPVA